MRIELLPGETNVVRFPVDRRARPTMDLLREIVPDVRELSNLLDSIRAPMPPKDLRARTDAETARHIAEQAPRGGEERRLWLEALRRPVVERAVGACRVAHDLSVEMAAAQDRVLAAEMARHFWVDVLRELLDRTAEALLAAYLRSEEAEGVDRAVGLALLGEAWAPQDLDAEFDALVAFYARRAG